MGTSLPEHNRTATAATDDTDNYDGSLLEPICFLLVK
jgi:hypothetical protein